MNSFYERQHIKFRYGPLAQKTLHNVLKRELVEQFGFENMGLIADGLIHRFLEILDDFDPQRRTLLPGQVLWLAVSRHDRSRIDQPMWRSKLLPVQLTLLDPDDLVQASQDTPWEDLCERRVVRLLKQAYDQGGVLGQHDVGVLLGLSQSTATHADARYNKRLRWEDRATQGCDPSAHRRPEAEVSRRPSSRRGPSFTPFHSRSSWAGCHTILTSAFGSHAVNPTVTPPRTLATWTTHHNVPATHPKTRPLSRDQVRLSRMIHDLG